ncbi:transcriptional regulator [Rhodococcus sp. IEGM 1318]|uniref:transcriptional regulator n=1 Tax=Rhodococcus sp. IEGM 1318 TaxID=3082226 RepID=UPI00295463B7|nr:transcriptional regulator [Rhodococcus sp. IEGM 1318]MDV8009193.1 transcriptional regulator [Rhodococcus sp. IEGM 1318]
MGDSATAAAGGKQHRGARRQTREALPPNCDAGLVEVKKGYSGKRPRTWISLTSAGRSALVREIRSLKAIVAGLGPGRRQ